MSPRDDDLDHLAPLADPARRAVYRFVVDHATGADRNQVAAALDLSRSLAAYHLDRLVDDGLLVARFEHRGERRGPGSGRPSKVYERAPTDFEVSLPPRDYGLAAEVMAEALELLDDQGAAALRTAAARHGRQQREERAGSVAPRRRGRSLTEVARELEACGYEPYQRGDCLRMRNCPFDAIAREHRDLVCHMNLALLEGLLDRDGDAVELELEPADDECCVTIRRASTTRT